MTELLKYSSRPRLNNPALVVCWEADAGEIGLKVSEHLVRQLGGQAFCEIEPSEFFALGGVAIVNDVVQFPESTFYAVPDRNLIVFYSTIPRYEFWRFLNLITDVAEEYHAREVYTIGGMITLAAHTAPRDFWATFNTAEMKAALAPYRLSREMDFETPPGGRPTLNAFMLWTAKRRGLPGANLWVPVPFYLVGMADPRAHKRILEFLSSRLNLGLDLGPVDAEIARQDEKLARLRAEDSEVDSIITKLETDHRLTEEEHEKLVKAVEDFLKKA